MRGAFDAYSGKHHDVAHMKAVHARFKGKPGTLGQYGDSITCTMAFLASHSYGATAPCTVSHRPD